METAMTENIEKLIKMKEEIKKIEEKRYRIMYEYLKGSGEQWGGAEGVRCHLPTHELPTPAPKPWLSQNELFLFHTSSFPLIYL